MAKYNIWKIEFDELHQPISQFIEVGGYQNFLLAELNCASMNNVRPSTRREVNIVLPAELGTAHPYEDLGDWARPE